MKPYFIGNVETGWLDDGRNMILLSDFSFVDSRGHEWPCPGGSIINGANIPRFCWGSIGSPYVGKYNHRKASVPHDVACVVRNMPHERVHEMYHEALLCAGVPEEKAKLLGEAVKKFGPKWDVHGNNIFVPDPRKSEEYKFAALEMGRL